MRGARVAWFCALCRFENRLHENIQIFNAAGTAFGRHEIQFECSTRALYTGARSTRGIRPQDENVREARRAALRARLVQAGELLRAKM